MILLHHLENSRSHRVAWMLEELELPYEIKFYKRTPQMFAPPELKAVHPLGKSPVITDEGVSVAESGAILEYLVRKSGGRLRPAAGSPEELRYTYWMHYAEGSLMPPLLTTLVFGQLTKQKLPFFVAPIVKEIVAKVNKIYLGPQRQLHADFIESELAKGRWLAGDEFTAADIHMSFPLSALMLRGSLRSDTPRIKALLNAYEARPAYQRALKKGGGLELSL